MQRRVLLLGTAGLTGAVTRPTRAQPAAAVDLAGYRQTFAAAFNDPHAPLSRRDGGTFTTRFEQWGGLRTLAGNQEMQLYADPAFVPSPAGTDALGRDDAPPGQGTPLGYDPFRIHDGCLEIAAIPAPPALRGRIDRPYLSGMISTEWSFTQRFGYFEMRAHLPRGRGLWPAFWMVSDTASEHIEIDVMEAIGERSRIYCSVHAPKRGKQFHVGLTPRPGFDYADGMHTYGMLWTPEEVTFFVDGARTTGTEAAALRDAPPMYMIVNLAIGGVWAGPPPPETPFPAVLRIDYIRAWQKR